MTSVHVLRLSLAVFAFRIIQMLSLHILMVDDSELMLGYRSPVDVQRDDPIRCEGGSGGCGGELKGCAVRVEHHSRVILSECSPFTIAGFCVLGTTGSILTASYKMEAGSGSDYVSYPYNFTRQYSTMNSKHSTDHG